MLPEGDRAETLAVSGLDPAGVDRVAVYPHRLRFLAEHPLVVPPPRLPNMLRGTFEIAAVVLARCRERVATDRGD